MRFLTLLAILTASLLTACRSHKEAHVEFSEAAVIDSHVDSSYTFESSANAISQSETDLTMEQISVEFFPPDSMFSDPHIIPKRILIHRVSSSRTSDSAIFASTASFASSSSDSCRNVASYKKSDTVSDIKTSSIPYCLIVWPVILIGLFLLIRYFKSKMD